MANRADEKARRREERKAAEEAERKAAARKQRMGIIGGVVAALAVVAVAGVLIASGGGDGKAAEDGGRTPSANLPTLPVQQESDYEKAAEAAGCVLQHPAIEGAGHESREFTAADYKTNPPTSGNHFPQWYEDGIYAAGDNLELGQLVHTLEHGRINVQYKPGTSAADILKLESLLAESEDGYHMLLYQNGTDMPFAVAATAWGHLLGCETLTDDTWDALRTFRARYIDKGPEQVP
jgi:hypothetical protein